MKEENLIWIDRLIKDRPDYFKQGIIDHCRKLDNYDVYEWVANDEIKIQQLHKEKDQLQNNWNELKQFIESELCSKYIHKYDVLDKMNELEGKSE